MGNNNANNELFQRLYKKVSGDYHKEMFDYYMLLAGVVGTIACVASGIFFSQYAISNVLGATGWALAIGWGVALAISSLEIAGVKLLGNKDTSNDIRDSNRFEHKIATYSTWGLFLFDVVSNIFGSYAFAIANNIGKITTPAYVIITLVACFLGISELVAGWLLRGLGVSKVKYDCAKEKYFIYKEKFDKMTQQEESQQSKSISIDPYSNNEFEDHGSKPNHNLRPEALQPAMQRSANPYRGNGRNQPRG